MEVHGIRHVRLKRKVKIVSLKRKVKSVRLERKVKSVRLKRSKVGPSLFFLSPVKSPGPPDCVFGWPANRFSSFLKFNSRHHANAKVSTMPICPDPFPPPHRFNLTTSFFWARLNPQDPPHSPFSTFYPPANIEIFISEVYHFHWTSQQILRFS